MRRADGYTEAMFTMAKLDDLVPPNHSLRPIRIWLNEALKRTGGVLARMYESDAKGDGPNIAPERLIRALLLQVLYSIRSERALMKQISYNILFRRFVGLSMDDSVWNHSTFNKNRDRLLAHDVIIGLFNETVKITAHTRHHLLGEHFTLIQAWAGHKSFERKKNSDDNTLPDYGARPREDRHGEKRDNEMHESSTDSQVKLFRKGRIAGAPQDYMGHLRTNNRHRLLVNAEVTQVSGSAEHDAAGRHARRCGATCWRAHSGWRGQELRHSPIRRLMPHQSRYAPGTNDTPSGGCAMDGSMTRWPGYAISERKRKCIEQVFGWGKTVGRIRQAMYRGREQVKQLFLPTRAAYNLTLMHALAATAV